MPTVLEIFKDITKFQRCSGVHKEFITYMQDLSKKLNYLCLVDEKNNILCKKENSSANIVYNHYDIVCLEKKTIPQIIEDDTTLKASCSTLGADNGIGCSYMIALMYENYDLEFLFTSDEEIGLIGANDLKLLINAKYMLNLDSEEEVKFVLWMRWRSWYKAVLKIKDSFKWAKFGSLWGINFKLSRWS